MSKIAFSKLLDYVPHNVMVKNTGFWSHEALARFQDQLLYLKVSPSYLPSLSFGFNICAIG